MLIYVGHFPLHVRVRDPFEGCSAQISFEPDLNTWARHHSKELERVLYMNCLARARRKGHDNRRKEKQMQMIFAVKKQENKITEGLRTF